MLLHHGLLFPLPFAVRIAICRFPHCALFASRFAAAPAFYRFATVCCYSSLTPCGDQCPPPAIRYCAPRGHTLYHHTNPSTSTSNDQIRRLANATYKASSPRPLPRYQRERGHGTPARRRSTPPPRAEPSRKRYRSRSPLRNPPQLGQTDKCPRDSDRRPKRDKSEFFPSGTGLRGGVCAACLGCQSATTIHTQSAKAENCGMARSEHPGKMKPETSSPQMGLCCVSTGTSPRDACLPPGSQASVPDVAEAYRTVPANPSQWPGLVIRPQAEDQFAVNVCNNFGLASAGSVYRTIVDAGADIFRGNVCSGRRNARTTYSRHSVIWQTPSCIAGHISWPSLPHKPGGHAGMFPS